jgi:hypothetical protein
VNANTFKYAVNADGFWISNTAADATVAITEVELIYWRAGVLLNQAAVGDDTVTCVRQRAETHWIRSRLLPHSGVITAEDKPVSIDGHTRKWHSYRTKRTIGLVRRTAVLRRVFYYSSRAQVFRSGVAIQSATVSIFFANVECQRALTRPFTMPAAVERVVRGYFLANNR